MNEFPSVSYAGSNPTESPPRPKTNVPPLLGSTAKDDVTKKIDVRITKRMTSFFIPNLLALMFIIAK
jgi:hypothetical protein